MESPEAQPRFEAPPGAMPNAGYRSAVAQKRRATMDAHLAGLDLRLLEGDAAAVSVPRLSIRTTRLGAVGRRVFDLVGAVLIGLLFSPFIVAVMALIRLGGTPVIFRHRRIGQSGSAFDCLKFRTMVPDAENVLRRLLKEHPEIRDEWTQNHKLRDDPRITPIGRFLRRTSLDELPQLWNVLRGDMSLVGPRPIVRVELLRYGKQAALYLAVKPGLTGLWQVKGRSDTTYRRRVAMDKYYVRNRNLLMD